MTYPDAKAKCEEYATHSPAIVRLAGIEADYDYIPLGQPLPDGAEIVARITPATGWRVVAPCPHCGTNGNHYCPADIVQE